MTKPLALDFFAVDQNGNPITDLKAEELRVSVNKEDRNISSISAAPKAPKTIGLFFDISGSRRSDKHIEQEIQAAAIFLQSTWHEGDEGFVLAFNSKPYFVARLTNNLNELVESLPKVVGGTYYGSTALYDALCVVQLKNLESTKREMLYVILSDFEDNASKHSKVDSARCLAEAGVKLFPILLHESFGPDSSSGKSQKRARETAKEMAERSGGEALSPHSAKDLGAVFQRLANDLSATYWLELKSLPADGAPMKVHIEVTRPHANILYAHN